MSGPWIALIACTPKVPYEEQSYTSREYGIGIETKYHDILMCSMCEYEHLPSECGTNNFQAFPQL